MDFRHSLVIGADDNPSAKGKEKKTWTSSASSPKPGVTWGSGHPRRRNKKSGSAGFIGQAADTLGRTSTSKLGHRHPPLQQGLLFQMGLQGLLVMRLQPREPDVAEKKRRIGCRHASGVVRRHSGLRRGGLLFHSHVHPLRLRRSVSIRVRLCLLIPPPRIRLALNSNVSRRVFSTYQILNIHIS